MKATEPEPKPVEEAVESEVEFGDAKMEDEGAKLGATTALSTFTAPPWK